MSRRRRRQEIQEQDSGSGWMTTFSDLVTLLLTFFVLLYSFSSLDAGKFKSLAQALQSALNVQADVFEGNDPSGEVPIPPIIQPSPTPKPPVEEPEDLHHDKITKFYGQIKEAIEGAGLAADISLSTNERGVIVEIKEHVLFDSGRADLKPRSREFLDRLVPIIDGFDNMIIVEGHTDNVPMSSEEFPTNWELSVTRAVRVIRYFHEQKGMDPSRLAAEGYGEYHPIVPNDSDENRTLNRRVNLMILVPEDGEEDGTG
ncbi:MAG TPA: flagellar motor protein MotB [Bacillota bacterium]|nr:flagellar motor protein MotB [Bacillota bacterium]